MERLTKRYTYNRKSEISVDSEKNGISCSNFCTNCGEADCEDIRKALFKLAEYEDLEEQGKLLKLPCAVGETVYAIMVDENNFEHFHCGTKISELQFDYWMLPVFGKSIFLIKEEAEAALKEL